MIVEVVRLTDAAPAHTGPSLKFSFWVALVCGVDQMAALLMHSKLNRRELGFLMGVSEHSPV